jgi:hypothetical protein
MRGVLVIALVIAVPASRAAADPTPPGAIGVVSGITSGTGADAKRIGAGYYQFGAQASWVPLRTSRLGLTLRAGTMFGTLYGGSAAQIEPSLKTVQMDATVGLRFRPWSATSRFLTLRGGGELLRVNEPIPPMNQRAFLGGIGSIGLDQYVSDFLISIDIRYGLIGNGPGELALLVGIGRAGP